MKPHELALAIKELSPDAEFTFEETNLDSLVYLVEPAKKPTKAQILAKVEEMKIAEENQLNERKAKKQILLDRLGITSEEANLLLS